MTSGQWVALGIVVFMVVFLAACEIRDNLRTKKAHRAVIEASEVPAPNLRHLRIVTGATCMACRKKPADDPDGIHCKACKARIHENGDAS